MNKEEYLTRLQYCISQLPPVEAQNTMQYYREYFDDAGEENFASVMAELGTPEQLAAKICSSYGINYQQPVNENNTSKAVIIAIIAVLTCPIWFTAGIVILSLVFSAFHGYFEPYIFCRSCRNMPYICRSACFCSWLSYAFYTCSNRDNAYRSRTCIVCCGNFIFFASYMDDTRNKGSYFIYNQKKQKIY